MAEASNGAAAEGWYVVVAGAPPVGPYDLEGLKGLAASSHINAASLLWKEGRSSWDPLSGIPELSEVLQAAVPAATTTTSSSGQPQQPAKKKVIAAQPSSNDPLAAFQAEISAIEAENAAAAAEGEPADGPSTPEELEFEDDDGTKYIWDKALRKYVPASQAEAAAAAGGGGRTAAAAAAGADPASEYGIEAMTYAGDDEAVPTLESVQQAEAAAAAAAAADAEEALLEESLDPKERARLERKRKTEAAIAEHKERAAKKKEAQKQQLQQQQGWFDLKVNTSVYVTGLPDDTDAEEVAEVFSKCGILKLGDDGQPRIKLYRDKASGVLKGDALVTYLKEPSVPLACSILDGSSFRPGGPPMSVTVAKFELKGEYQPKANAGKGKGKGGGGGGGNSSSRKQQLERLEKKLGWGGFDDKLPPEKVTVVLKHMFRPEEFSENLMLSEELEEEVTAECSKLGALEKVKVFKNNPDGVITVKFKEEEPAQACIKLMNGRFFGGQQIEAGLWDGTTNFLVKGRKETAEEEAARLEAYARELEKKEANEPLEPLTSIHEPSD